ncbi:hypothetical protein P8452_14332 [Trifolium repens]|nr:hypothetical protein P8452_14332 [Trifolium repens]
MAPKNIKEENQRIVFTEEDDLIILKAIPKFMSETGETAYSHDFHTFVKNKVSGKISFKQLNRKIRGFKTKYGKEGETFTKTHEKKSLKLFMKIDWGTKGGSKSGSKSAEKENQDLSSGLVNFNSRNMTELSFCPLLSLCRFSLNTV